MRACRLAGAISRLSATYQQGWLTLQRKRTGGNQYVTVKHIHQQVNVTEGGQAVVAGESGIMHHPDALPQGDARRWPARHSGLVETRSPAEAGQGPGTKSR